MSAKVHLGALIRAWRNSRDMSQRECAELIGITNDALIRLEKGLAISHVNFKTVLVWALGEKR